MIFFGSRTEALQRKAREIAASLLDITDPIEQSMLHSRAAHNLTTWRHLWVAAHVDEAWVAISNAMVYERIHRTIKRSGPHNDFTQIAQDIVEKIKHRKTGL